jgi:hypothetical protein
VVAVRPCVPLLPGVGRYLGVPGELATANAESLLGVRRCAGVLIRPDVPGV